MTNIYSRVLRDDGNGTVVWIAWCDQPGIYEVGLDKVTAERRLRERSVDWRFIALSALMNQPFEGVTALEKATIEETILRIRNLDDRLERR